jgi:molybdate transport system substrate-binding protein
MADEVLVFAASSLTDALSAIARRHEKQSDDRVVLSFTSSSTLARQVERGAPADIYASADSLWMDYLEKRALIRAGTRADLVSNRLVLVAPVDSALAPVDIAAGVPIAAMLGNGPLAMGDPAHVPAGIYGKQALRFLNVWSRVKDRIAGAPDVRAALALVASGEAPLGVVYLTDARAEKNVKILGIIPQAGHAPIVYPVAITAASDSAGAQAFYEYMLSREAADTFRRYDFITPY